MKSEFPPTSIDHLHKRLQPVEKQVDEMFLEHAREILRNAGYGLHPIHPYDYWKDRDKNVQRILAGRLAENGLNYSEMSPLTRIIARCFAYSRGVVALLGFALEKSGVIRDFEQLSLDQEAQRHLATIRTTWHQDHTPLYEGFTSITVVIHNSLLKYEEDLTMLLRQTQKQSLKAEMIARKYEISEAIRTLNSF